MAAPDGIKWGSIAGGYGRIGIYTNVASNHTTTNITVQVWFWSKYSVSDLYYYLYLDNSTVAVSDATTAVQTPQSCTEIRTLFDSGTGWSESNQVCIYSKTYSGYTRDIITKTRYISAKLTAVDRVGADMKCLNVKATIPALQQFTISYNANGGSGAPNSHYKWYGKSITLSTTTPTRPGYSFSKWTTSSNGGGTSYNPGASYTANSSATLYAQWSGNTYTVQFNANGGTYGYGNATKTHGQDLTLPTTIPTRTNYTFKGWGTSASTSTVSYSPGSTYRVNANITLYAVWELAYVKPKISEFVISRTETNDITCSFGFECTYNLTKIVYEWEDTNGVTGSRTMTASDLGISSTTGTVSQPFNGTFSTETTYNYRVSVYDSEDYTSVLGVLGSTRYTVDFLYGGNGVSVGKVAEIKGVFDVALKTLPRGGYLYPVLEPDTDLNSVKTPNVYTGADLTTYKYINYPNISDTEVLTGTFTLKVDSCGDDGQLRQEFICCDMVKPKVFVRFYHSVSGTQTWGPWCKSSRDEVVLYEEPIRGNAAVVNLQYSSGHFTYLEIYYTDNNMNGHGYTKVYRPNGKQLHLQLQEGASTAFFRQTKYTISGTTITADIDNASYIKIHPNGTVTTSFGVNYIRIIKVVGLA